MPEREQFAQLDELGYTVIPAFMDRQMTAAIRTHMDALLPPIKPPTQLEGSPVKQLRHPIPGALMAEILDRPALLGLARELLRATDLYLLEQVLIRTDPAPPPHGPGGWHIDFAFVSAEYDCTPRQTYYHHVQACSTLVPGGGAFMIVPGSHRQTYAAAARLGLDHLDTLKQDPVKVAGVDLSRAIEVLPQDGDLLVFNPMAVHSASGNASTTPRYVYFSSFMAATNQRLCQHLRQTQYLKSFPASLRAGLSPAARPLLDWLT